MVCPVEGADSAGPAGEPALASQPAVESSFQSGIPEEAAQEANLSPDLKKDPGERDSGINFKAGFGPAPLGIYVVSGLLEFETSLKAYKRWAGFKPTFKWLIQAGGGTAFWRAVSSNQTERSKQKNFKTDPYISVHTGFRSSYDDSWTDSVWTWSLTLGAFHSKELDTNAVAAISFGSQLPSSRILIEVNLALSSMLMPYLLLSVGVPLFSY